MTISANKIDLYILLNFDPRKFKYKFEQRKNLWQKVLMIIWLENLFG